MKPALLAQARRIVAAPSFGGMFDAARGTAFAPQQRRDEIVPFCEMLANRKLGTVLEIGTGRGLTALMLARACERVMTVGIPEKPPSRAAERKRALEEVVDNVAVMCGDSHDFAVGAVLGAVFLNEELGVLFLDGDHTYAGLTRDHEMYAPLVRPGGVVALHDTRPSRSGLGAVRLVEELREKHAVTDIWPEEKGRRGYGLSWYTKEPSA